MGGRGGIANSRVSTGSGERVQSSSTQIPISRVGVDGENQYRFTNGKRPSGVGTWAFNIGGEEVFISGSYANAKKEAKKRAAQKGLMRIRVLT